MFYQLDGSDRADRPVTVVEHLPALRAEPAAGPRRVFFPHLAGTGDAVQPWQVDVQQGDVGRVRRGRLHDGVTAAHLGHDGQVGLEVEQRGQGPAHQRLVVGEQQPDGHAALTASSKPLVLSVAATGSTRPPCQLGAAVGGATSRYGTPT